jgi:7-carboxy-7-deazaguanine synthase
MAGIALPAETVPASNTLRTKTYRVRGVWKTLQGEGLFAGRPAVFVRFVGCNMWTGYEQNRERDFARTGAACALWCDTEFTKEGSTATSAEALVAALLAVAGDVRFCVLTGGEPLLQVDAVLVRELKAVGFQVATETNGTVSVVDACRDAETGEVVAPDWIVCSPKLPESHLQLEFFDELKLVVPDYRPERFQNFSQRARPHVIGGQRLPLLWLQSEDGPRYDETRQMAIDLALSNPSWRVSVQTHKILNVE